MSTNQKINGKGNCVLILPKLYYAKSADAAISGWLREMDGESTEEDWSLHTNHSKLDGQNSSLSFKKVFKHSPSAVHYYQ
jgi:hypothetical protein